jgi:hypothetical protein
MSGRTTRVGRFIRATRSAVYGAIIDPETDDPSMQGEMRVTYTLTDAEGGAHLLAVHEGLPPGVPLADNELGWRLALDNLAALLESR